MLLTEGELATYLHVGRPFLWSCRQAGMPFIRLGTKIIRYDLNAVLQWFSSNPDNIQKKGD